MIYRRVLRYYRPFLGSTLAGSRSSRSSASGSILLKPWPFKFIVDQILPTELRLPRRPMPIGTATFPLLCLASSVSNCCGDCSISLTNYIFVKVGLQALLKLRTDLYAYLQSLSLKYHDARRSADSSFRVAYDSQAIQTIYNKGFTNIFGSVITLVGMFVIMLRLDWQLTLLSLGIVPLIVGAIYFFAHRIRTRIHLHPGTGQRAADPGAGRIELRSGWCTPSGAKISRSRNSTSARSESLQANLRLTLTNVKSALVISTLMVIGTAAMYYLGTLHVLAGTLTLGSLLVFSAYLVMLYQPLEELTYTAWAMEGATAGRATLLRSARSRGRRARFARRGCDYGDAGRDRL